MPEVKTGKGMKKFPYTKKGKMAASKFAKKQGKGKRVLTDGGYAYM